uniref:SUEL-type lectin domain-containing protein n=1 Tax=Neolamprologus brichardi TaxID=32507 RepID=A0A3Q4H0I6_NEOBR
CYSSFLSLCLLCAVSCYVLVSVRPQFRKRSRFHFSTLTAVCTCGNCENSSNVSNGVIVVESVELTSGDKGHSSQHDKLKVIKKSDLTASCISPHSCDGKKTCDIDIQIFGTPVPGRVKDTTWICFIDVQTWYKGEVIVVYWADYGRRDTTTCSQHRPTHEIHNARCPNPTTKVADSCNGKSSCIIKASNSVFGDPCPGTYKYLEVSSNVPSGHFAAELWF